MRVNPNYVVNLAVALNSTQASKEQLSQQLSSGVRVNSIGQDPIAAGQNVMLLNQIRQDDCFTQSANLVTGRLQVADSALGSVVSQLTTAVSLAISANNGTKSANDVQAISHQLAGIRDEVMTLATSADVPREKRDAGWAAFVAKYKANSTIERETVVCLPA